MEEIRTPAHARASYPYVNTRLNQELRNLRENDVSVIRIQERDYTIEEVVEGVNIAISSHLVSSILSLFTRGEVMLDPLGPTQIDTHNANPATSQD